MMTLVETPVALEAHTLPDSRMLGTAANAVWVEPWADPVVSEFGHAIRSDYVERFWLGLLGPSATWLLRAISYGFDSTIDPGTYPSAAAGAEVSDVAPQGFTLPIAETARVLGLGDRVGRHSPFQRSVTRLCSFGIAYMRSETLVVREIMPWLEPRQVRRLSPGLQREHTMWEQAEHDRSPVVATRRRAASVAMSTVRTGGTVDDAERALIRSKVHPSLSRSLAEWAWEQHQLSVRAAKHEGTALEL